MPVVRSSALRRQAAGFEHQVLHFRPPRPPHAVDESPRDDRMPMLPFDALDCLEAHLKKLKENSALCKRHPVRHRLEATVLS